MTATMQKLLLTTREAAAFVGCGRNTLKRWRETAGLKAVYVGTHPRYRTADLEAFLGRRAQQKPK